MHRSLGSLAAACAAIIACNANAATIRVDHNSTTNGPGTATDWSNAYTNLTGALNHPGLAGGDQIWVAQGTYYPGASQIDVFELKNGVIILGGFIGNETDADDRDPENNETILSGDLDDDDDVDFANRTDNSLCVVKVPSTASSANTLLDGFTIKGGHDGISDFGAGIHALGRATIRGCIVTDNDAVDGGGGGFYGTSASDVTFRNCTIDGNLAGIGGGLSSDGTLRVLNTIVRDNDATLAGGGLYSASTHTIKVIACTFEINESERNGGAIFVNGDDLDPMVLTIANTKFIGNIADVSGGAVYAISAVTSTVANATFSDNVAGATAGGWYQGLSAGSVSTLTNNIFWDDTAPLNPEIHNVAGTLTLTYSDVEGNGTSGTNIDSDPNFDANHKLQCPSPCINKGSDSAAPTDAEDANENTNITEKIDRDFAPRLVAAVDMGAYEKPIGCAADVTGNGVVNVEDLLAVIAGWGGCAPAPASCPADIKPGPCEGDGVVDVQDLLAVINAWGLVCATGEFSDVGDINSVEDCMDAASLVYEPFSAEWDEAVEKCVEALCAAEIIDCD